MNYEFDPIYLQKMVDRTGVSPKHLAHATGVPFTSVQSYLARRATPSLWVAVALADYFGVSLDVLVGHCSAAEALAAIDKLPPSSKAKLSSPDQISAILAEDISEIPTSRQAAISILRCAGCETIGDVVAMIESGEITRLSGIGRQTYNILCRAITFLTGDDYLAKHPWPTHRKTTS